MTNNADLGVGSLRAAVDAANALGGTNSITIPAGQIITLTSNDTLNPFAFGPTALVVAPGDNLTISGAGTISGGGTHRVFGVLGGGTLTLQSVTVTGGRAQGGNGGAYTGGGGGGGGGGGAGMGGAAFVATGGTLNLVQSTVSGNQALGGAGGNGAGIGANNGNGGGGGSAAFKGGNVAVGGDNFGGGGGGVAGPGGDVTVGFPANAIGGLGGMNEQGAQAAGGGTTGPGTPGANGTLGGGGGGSGTSTPRAGGNGFAVSSGGFGGGGGGGSAQNGVPHAPGGAGGFGAGGGGAYGTNNPFFPGDFGGAGGFGGGGGGVNSAPGVGAGAGGFGGGAGFLAGGGGAGMGGALFNNGGTITITNSTFTSNSVVGGTGGNPGQGLGGAIFQRAGTTTFIGTTFTNNSATGGAGAPPATSDGGAIYIDAGSTAQAQGAPIFTGNTATTNPNVAGPLVIGPGPGGGGTPAKLTSVTSSTASGKYNAGDTINVTVNFDQPVTLSSGNLVVNLNDGATVTISPFSNSKQVSGSYTVAPGQNTQSLDSTSVIISGGTLKDAGGNTVATTIPTSHSLANTNNFLIDTTLPAVSISPPSAPAATTGPITYTIIYADTNFNANTLTTADITLNKTGTANGTVSVSGGSGASQTVTISNITGTGTLGISLAAGTASDTAGNLAPAAGPSATFNVVNIPPTVAAFAVGGSNGTVRLLSETGMLITSVTPITGYTGLVSVALGDFSGDTVPDLAVAAAAPAGQSGLTTTQAGKVFVYDGAALAKGTLTLIHTFTPFASSSSSTGAYTNGLNIAAGDINGDGHVDLVAGTRGGNGTTSGQIESGRLVVIDGTSAAGTNTVIGGIQTPFSAGYQKGVIVAAGNVDGTGGDEIAVTRGGPVSSTNPTVQSIKVKVLQLQGAALTELHLAANGSTAFAPFAGLSGPANAINRDGRVAFVDSNGDGKAELVFSALDPLTSPTNQQVRVGVYSINAGATSGAATIQSTGPDAGTYRTGTAVQDYAITHVAATGAQQNLALLTESASSGIVYLAPLTGAVQAGGFSLNVLNGGITIDGI
ncbi:MAG: hypothetical protein K8U57_26600 [Planctomycetes bacterium]|nr:hypothetical protein [Planctomycetota bacterium]